MKKLLSKVADFLGLGIYQRMARAKERLLKRDRLLFNPDRTQIMVLDAFFCQVADLLSFGKVAPSSVRISEVPPTEILDLGEFSRSLDPFSLLASVVAPLIHLRRERRHNGKRVDALNVVWLNMPHRENNPFEERGNFVAVAYSNPITKD